MVIISVIWEGEDGEIFQKERHAPGCCGSDIRMLRTGKRKLHFKSSLGDSAIILPLLYVAIENQYVLNTEY